MVTTELRTDPVTGRWVAIELAAARSRFEFEAAAAQAPSPEPQAAPCAFCEGHESAAGFEILAWREGTPAGGPGWSVRVVPNPAAVLRIEGRPEVRRDALFESRDGLGAHEVVIETPHHGEALQDLPVERLWRVLWAWRTRLQDLKRDRRFVAGAAFKNHGRLAGALMDHAHSQVVAFPVVPPALEERLRGCEAHHAAGGTCVYCDLLKAELAAGARVVFEASQVVVLAPYASRVPFEVMLLPRAHAARFEEASDEELTGLATALRRVLTGIDWALERPAFNLALYTGPFDAGADGWFHWHVEVAPRVTRMGGLEWGSGLHRNPVAPEEAASVLRASVVV